MNRMLTILFIILIFPFLLFAQWPTEPLTGIRLSNTTNRYERFKASCPDGEGGYFICIETSGRLYINHIDLNGNIRWSIDYPPEECFTDSHPGIDDGYYGRGHVEMVHNPRTEETWVIWEDFRHGYPDETGYPTSSEVYIQKFNSDRIAQLNGGEAVLIQAKVDTTLTIYVDDRRNPNHISLCDDNSVLVVFSDSDQYEYYYDGNLWAQRISQNGDLFWEYPGKKLIPDDIWDINYGPNKYFSDGNDGLMFTFKSNPLRILPNGELAWDYETSEIERIVGARDYCAGFNNTMVVIGDGRWQNDEDELVFATVVDTSGNFVYGPTSIGNPENDFPGYNINMINSSEYGVLGESDEGVVYYSLDQTLNEVLTEVIIDSIPIIYPQGNFKLSRFGYRLFSKYIGSSYQDTHHEMWGWDIEGNHLFTHGLDQEPNEVTFANFWVDDSGNTWCIWMRGHNGAELYANIISPDGEWGIASNSVDSPSPSTSLPSEISLHVYPNPGNGQFNVSFDLVDPSPATFILTNVLGQRLYSYDLPRDAVAPGLPGNVSGSCTEQMTLDLNDQASGTYFLQLRTESGQVKQKRILLIK